MKKGKNVLFGVLILIAAVAVGYLVYYFTSQYSNEQIYEDLKEEVQATPTATPEPTAVPETTESITPTMVPATVDFQPLWDVNPEVVAWIEVPGTVIAYPVLQSASDDTYYLDHTIEGVAGYPGSIYIESNNHATFSDYNTVLYGHNMKNGTMFTDLHKYTDLSYMQTNHQVIIDTPEQKRTYEIFAAVSYSDAHILNVYDNMTLEGRQEFLDSIYHSSGVFRDDVEVTAADQILTLSTCITGQDNKRFLVEAVLVNE